MQRWPAVPIAAKAMARRVRFEIGGGADDGAVIAAEFQDRPRKAPREDRRDGAAHAGRARRRDERHAAVCGKRFAGLARAQITEDEEAGALPPPARKRASARSNSACAASAVSGVFSDGFQTQALPQTSASAAFHAQTATGKLKADMMPVTPSGCQVSIMRWFARSDAMVSP